MWIFEYDDTLPAKGYSRLIPIDVRWNYWSAHIYVKGVIIKEDLLTEMQYVTLDNKTSFK